MMAQLNTDCDLFAKLAYDNFITPKIHLKHLFHVDILLLQSMELHSYTMLDYSLYIDSVKIPCKNIYIKKKSTPQVFWHS